MNLKKPNFWDQKTPNLFAYLLLPIALIIKIFIYFKKKPDNSKMNIKTICIGNFYIGGTGKTSLCIKINQILEKRKIKSCFIKKFYKNQEDEQKLLENNGKLFLSLTRREAIQSAIDENYKVKSSLNEFSNNRKAENNDDSIDAKAEDKANKEEQTRLNTKSK